MATPVPVDADVDPDATQTYRAPSEEALAAEHTLATDWPSPRTPPPPPPPFEEHPERPLFASTERKVPAGARAGAAATGGGTGSQPATPADTGAGQGTGHGTGQGTGHGAGQGTGQHGFWPFAEEPVEPEEVHTGTEGRGWLRTAVVVGVLLVLVIAMAVAFNRGREDASNGSAPNDQGSAEARPQGERLDLAGVKDFDPESDDPQENPAEAPNAIDGDPATTWTTSTYYNKPELGGLKSGVGLMVDLGAEKEPRSVTVRFKGAPTSFEVYAAPAGVTQSPDNLEQLDKVGARAGAPEQATVRLDPAPKTRYLLVWLTKLPAVDGGFRGEIAEISVRS